MNRQSAQVGSLLLAHPAFADTLAIGPHGDGKTLRIEMRGGKIEGIRGAR